MQSIRDEKMEDLKIANSINNCQKEQRTISDDKYAGQKDFSLVQKIVFTLISLIVVAVIVALINVVVAQPYGQ